MQRRRTLETLAVVVLVAAALSAALVLYQASRPWTAVVSLEPPTVLAAGELSVSPEPVARTLSPYEGLGTWIDAFDYSPAYGVEPDFESMVQDMADHGVRTIFVQSGRLDDRSPETLEDRWVLAELLLRSHQHDIAVVAWFLPKWTDPDEDLRHLIAASTFEVLGHRFDGVAVDIEWNQDGLDAEERSAALVLLTERIAAAAPDDPLGAIVMPPVLLEIVNEDFWPEFPWTTIAPHYDVWLPMSYWSFRSNESGYGDGYAYNAESTRRIRANVGDPNAVVHGIGGIGATTADDRLDGPEPIAGIADVTLFAQSLVDTNSVGGSVYDWNTTDAESRDLLDQLFADGGLAADLGLGS